MLSRKKDIETMGQGNLLGNSFSWRAMTGGVIAATVIEKCTALTKEIIKTFVCMALYFSVSHQIIRVYYIGRLLRKLLKL